MNPGILYWGTLLLAVAAGAGIMAVIELFRGRAPRVDPVTAAAQVIADALGPLAQASATIPPVTAHRSLDTMDIYQEGLGTGQLMALGRQPGRVPRNDDSNGYVSGPGPEPGHPYPFPAGVDPLDTRQPWITETHRTPR